MDISNKLKIIACVDFQCDFLANGLLAGLYETGHDIYEVPILGSVRGKVDEDYTLPDGNRGMTGPPGYLSAEYSWQPPARPTEEAVELMVKKEANLVIMLSTRDYARQSIDYLSRQSGWAVHAMPLVMCDGEDYDSLDMRLFDTYRPKAFFKRESNQVVRLAEVSAAARRPVWPMPFSAFTRGYGEINDKEKEYDLFLSLGNTHPSRIELVKRFLDCVDKKGRKSYIAMSADVKIDHKNAKKMRNMLPWHEYIQAQAKSRITASIRGWGRDALHAWEAFSFATLVLYCPPGIHIPHPFQDRVHCVYFDENCLQVSGLIEDYLEDSRAAFQIATAGKEHLWRYHTNRARAEYLISAALDGVTGKAPDYEAYGFVG